MKNLTQREIEILKLILDEVSTVEIAGILHISKRTVDTHRHNIMRKTESNNLIALVKHALKNKLV